MKVFSTLITLVIFLSLFNELVELIGEAGYLLQNSFCKQQTTLKDTREKSKYLLKYSLLQEKLQ